MEQVASEKIAQNWVTWLDALASGKYRNVSSELHAHMEDETEGHCCLGVAQIVLGLDRSFFTSTDHRLIPLLGMHTSCGISRSDRNYSKSITDFNDVDHMEDVDFTNMHRVLLDDLEGFTHLHPEVAPLVRKMLAERERDMNTTIG